MAVTATDPIKIIFAILLPPDNLLTLLGYVPGIIHALYIILKH